MTKERELIKDMKILLECTYMGGLQRNADVLIGRAIELLAQPEEGVYQKLLRIEDGIEVEILPSELWQDGYEAGKRTMQPEQEPVAWRWKKTSGWAYQDNNNNGGEPLYTSPQTCDVVKLQNEVYQYRHKLPEDAFWSQWIECEIDYYKTYLSAPIKANIYGTLIEYQVRVLHKEPPTREPLSEKQIEYYLERLGSSFKWDDGFKAGVEWAERCHDITGVDDE